jgi:hypothetical protein
MSKINFKNLVETILITESLQNLFVPPNQTTVSINDIKDFTIKLHATGSLRLNKDFLISNKPLWPYGDTLEYITLQFASILPELKKSQFSDQVEQVVNFINSTEDKILGFADRGLTHFKGTLTPEMTNILDSIDKKLQYLNDNRLNYRNYFNTRLAQANDETSILAAEPYLNKTPKDAVISVLKDFGGYDQNIAEKIIKYPAESKYTQRGQNIDNMVMQNIIEISKLTLIFYREWVQNYANQIVDLLNYDRQFQQTISRTFIVNQQQLVKFLQQNAGAQDKKSFIEKIIKNISLFVGTENIPSDILQKLFHDDYLKFVEGQSVLVLNPESYSLDQSKNSLIKSINDFNGQPGKGQNIYESYLHLFNNIKKGELPSKWLAGISKAAGAIGALSVGMGPVN